MSTESTLKDCIAYLYQEARERAFHKRREFKLSFNTFQRLVQSNCSYCHLTAPHGQKVKYNEKTFRLNGIDRRSNDGDYDEGNVVACCLYCNFAKANSSVDDFLDWAARIVSNNDTHPLKSEDQARMIDKLNLRLVRKNNFTKDKEN